MTEQITGTGPPPPPPPELPEPTPGRRHSVLAWVMGSLGVLVAVIVIAGFLIHLPYVIISPGSATPLDSSVVQIDGAQTYPHAGNVLFLTVRVSTRDPNVWRVVTSWLDPDRDIEKRSDVVGCLSDAQNQAFNTELMDQSQNDAKYVALTRLGYTVHVDPAQIRVVEVCQGAPAYGQLEPGDRVLAVDGQDITDVGQIAPIVQSHRPGDDGPRHRRPQRHHPHGHRRRRQGVEGPPLVRAGAGVDQRDHLPRHLDAGVRDLSIPDQRQDQHRARRWTVGGPRLHPRDHRRPHTGEPHRREAGGGDRHHPGRRFGRGGRRCRAEGDHRAHERRAAHDRAEIGGGGRQARRGRGARRGRRPTSTRRWPRCSGTGGAEVPPPSTTAARS